MLYFILRKGYFCRSTDSVALGSSPIVHITKTNTNVYREVETIFKKIHEGLDLFNYYFSRHESSNNDSQREKLESDLKKEIKKLQKFRDQIKNWQGNDALEATIAPQKLQEHRRLVEEAMECYKDVEKNSKMKSFSNQSIMLASLEQGGRELSQEVLEAYEFLSGVVDDLNEQNEGLEEEYEKLSQKKSRKNALSDVEERKQEIDNFRLRNELHIEEIETIMSYLKMRKVSVDSVLAIQEDLKFYVESNQEPDFVDDDTLYDDLKREARENHEKNALVANDEHTDANDSTLGAFDNGIDVSASPDPESRELTSHAYDKHSKFASPSPLAQALESSAKPPNSVSSSLSLVPTHVSPKEKLYGKTDSFDVAQSAFITNLKPASTPTKPVGALKWSLAAAGASQTPEGSNGVELAPVSKSMGASSSERLTSTPVAASESNGNSESHDMQAKNSENVASSELLSFLTKNDKYSAHLEVLKNSDLLPVELDLFSNVEILKVPAGIQEFTLAYISTNKSSGANKLLRCPEVYTPYSSFIDKLEYSLTRQSMWRPVALLSKLCNYWQIIRTNNKFEQYVRDLELYNEKAPTEAITALNELTMVLFYGFYYGLLPLENIIAESYLFKLGWRPYSLDQEPLVSAGRIGLKTQCWLKKIGATTTSIENGVHFEVGDFRAFDARTWEIHVKSGFRFDPRFSQSAPSRSL